MTELVKENLDMGGRGSSGRSGGAGTRNSFSRLEKNLNDNSKEVIEGLKTANELIYDSERKLLVLMVNEGPFLTLNVDNWTETGIKVLPKHFTNIIAIDRVENSRNAKTIYAAPGYKYRN